MASERGELAVAFHDATFFDTRESEGVGLDEVRTTMYWHPAELCSASSHPSPTIIVGR